MKKFNFKIDNLELRSCDESLMNYSEHKTAEIVKWFKNSESCYTIGYFEKDSEEYFFKFVGDRPIDDEVDWNNFKQLIITGYIFLQDNKNE
jgi:hypothetical protein